MFLHVCWIWYRTWFGRKSREEEKKQKLTHETFVREKSILINSTWIWKYIHLWNLTFRLYMRPYVPINVDSLNISGLRSSQFHIIKLKFENRNYIKQRGMLLNIHLNRNELSQLSLTWFGIFAIPTWKWKNNQINPMSLFEATRKSSKKQNN